MIPVALILFFGLLAVGVLVLGLARSASLRYDETRTQLHQHPSDTLAYDVPDGQDPADVIVALTGAGYTAVEDLTAGTCRVLVQCPHSRHVDRSRVRAVIERVCATGTIAGGPPTHAVHFVDES